MSTFSFWKPGNIIRYQQNAYTSKTLLQLVKFEIIMLIESIPRKSIENHIFVNDLNEVVELIAEKIWHTMYAVNGKVSHIHRRMC
jgi:hypothetical protein